MKPLFKTCLLVILIALTSTSLFAIQTDKLTLKGNMTLVYHKLPAKADTISQAFSNGILYGRIRTNIFYYDWDTENYKTGGKNKDHQVMGIGGSLIYKSAPYKGISATFGLYTSQNPGFFREDQADVSYVKSGKDTFSRNKIKNGGGYDGSYGMTVLGQAYLQYDSAITTFIAGRQIFESVFTASNDTKMIPNTFDGISVEIKPFSDTRFQLAYFPAQKLRDHTTNHEVITYDDWNENDDSAVNKSLTKTLVGTDNELLIATANTKKIKNLNATISCLSVPDIISNLSLGAHYQINTGKWSITPGIRVMIQMDQLDAGTPVANLNGNTDGYAEPNNLDGRLYAARMDVKKGPFSFRIGYSKVADDADIIAPWRGFPTGGFTRAMAQYNWNADTEAYMLRCDYDFGKAGLISGFKMLARYALQDFDDKKPGVQPDSHVIHVDLIKELANHLEMKFRFGSIDGDKDTIDINGNLKTDISYNEYRLEFNYLF